MRIRFVDTLVRLVSLSIFIGPLSAQDLGPEFKKIKDGIYVESTNDVTSNCGIILTRDGAVLIDSGHNPTDSRAVESAIKKLAQVRSGSSSIPKPIPITRPEILSSPLPPWSLPVRAHRRR